LHSGSLAGKPYNHTREVFLWVLRYTLFLFKYRVPAESIPLDKLIRSVASICASSYPLDRDPRITLRTVMDGLPGEFLSAVIIALDEEFFRSTGEEKARDKYGEKDKHI